MRLKTTKLVTIATASLLIVCIGTFSLFLNKSHANHSKISYPDNDTNSISLNKNEITDLVATSHVLGTLCVVRDGEIVYTEGFGYADCSKKLCNDESILYPIASLQKQMTAVIIGQLVNENKLDYTTTLEEFYPDLPCGKGITVRDLLNHTSGLVMPEVAPDHVLKTEKEQLDNAIDTTLYLDNHTPAYSNGNYSLLAGIISQIDETSYAESLNKRLIEPLNMTHTYLWDQIPDGEKIATEYFYAHDTDYDQSNLVYSEELMSSLLGAGNIYATTTDLATFEIALSDDTLLTDDEYYALFDSNKDDITWRVGNISSDESRGGYSSYLHGDIGNKNMVIFLLNQSSNDSADVLLDTIYQESLLLF